MQNGVVLARMKQTAASLLRTAENLPNTQAIVLETVSGNEYAAVIADALSADHIDARALLERLTDAEDTAVKWILCQWADGGVDLPSMAFRRMLCELSPENLNAAVFLRTKDGYTVKPMGVTMK